MASFRGPVPQDPLAWDGEVEGDAVNVHWLLLLVGPGSSLVDPQRIPWWLVIRMKKNKRVIESDHNTSIVELNIQINKRKRMREEMFNLKNKHCQAAFKEATESKVLSKVRNGKGFLILCCKSVLKK